MNMKTSPKLVTVLLLIGSVLASASAILASPGDPGSKRPRYVDDTYGQPGGYIERQVRHELLMLPYYSVFDDISFRVDGYKVTLMGEVVRPTLKSDAENVVRRIEGVQQVVNDIRVLPVSIFDDGIRRATYRAIFRHPAMTRYAIQPVPPIHIIVENGHVTLVGVVANQMDRNIAYLQASGVPNVFSVSNQLRVEG
jgi:hyperosmotically inducible periplasmic protein